MKTQFFKPRKKKRKNPKSIPVARLRSPRLLDLGRVEMYWDMLRALVSKYGPTKAKPLPSLEDQKQPVSAHITPEKNWEITVKMKRDVSFRADRKLDQFLDKMGIVDPFQEVVKDVTCHEIGHWQFPRGSGVGCPYDNYYYHEYILDPAYEELKASGMFDDRLCKAFAKRIANCVMDIIDNFMVFKHSNASVTGKGQMLFWYLQGQLNKEYTAEYTLFVKANLAIWGHALGERLLGQFFTKMFENNGSNEALNKQLSTISQIVEELIPPDQTGDRNECVRLLNAFCRGTYQDRGWEYPRDVRAELGVATQILKRLFTEENMLDRERWKALTRLYTKLAIPYLKESEAEDMPPTSAGDESGEQGEPMDAQGGGQDMGDPDDSQPAEDDSSSPFGPLSNEDKEKIMDERKKNGEPMPHYLDKVEALHALYSSLSRRVVILPKEGSLPSANLPFLPVTRRRFDEEIDDIAQADFGRLFLDPRNRRLLPSTVTHRHSVSLPLEEDLQGFPDVAFALLDASGSMWGDGDKTMIPWGDESGYHYAVLTFYGMWKQLEYMQLLHKVHFSAGLFNTNTTTASGLEQCKKLLMTPSSGSTNLDMVKIREMIGGRTGVLFPFISDGDIDNWTSVKDEFIEIARKQQFFMVQVSVPTFWGGTMTNAGGGHSNASLDLQNAGLKVQVVKSYEDVVGLIIDLTAKTYESLIHAKMERQAKKYNGLSSR